MQNFYDSNYLSQTILLETLVVGDLNRDYTAELSNQGIAWGSSKYKNRGLSRKNWRVGDINK